MVNNVAYFSKVSFPEYMKTRKKLFAVENEYTEDELFEEWLNIKLPQRATTGSAGYDFYIPMKKTVCGESVLIPTGIRADIRDGWVLMLYPRSGMGMKYRMMLDNTTGVIDSDYFYADNEGHIMAKVHADTEFELQPGERFMQGVFIPFGIAENDNATAQRHGGMGSTGTK